MRTIEYRRYEAVAYAERWALGRNPAYYDFSKLGGDCTNFASQCIYAGCGVMNYTPVTGWYYIGVNDRAPAWTGAEELFAFLTANKSVGPFGRVTDSLGVRAGDIVQLGRPDGTFYHTPVIVRVEGEAIYVAAHSEDALFRPLSTYSYSKLRFVHIEGARMW